jgi:hypothetical protein
MPAGNDSSPHNQNVHFSQLAKNYSQPYIAAYLDRTFSAAQLDFFWHHAYSVPHLHPPPPSGSCSEFLITAKKKNNAGQDTKIRMFK